MDIPQSADKLETGPMRSDLSKHLLHLLVVCSYASTHHPVADRERRAGTPFSSPERVTAWSSSKSVRRQKWEIEERMSAVSGYHLESPHNSRNLHRQVSILLVDSLAPTAAKPRCQVRVCTYALPANTFKTRVCAGPEWAHKWFDIYDKSSNILTCTVCLSLCAN